MSEREGYGTETSKIEQWTLQVYAKIFTMQQQYENRKDMEVGFLKAKLIQFKCLSSEIRTFYILNVIELFYDIMW